MPITEHILNVFPKAYIAEGAPGVHTYDDRRGGIVNRAALDGLTAAEYIRDIAIVGDTMFVLLIDPDEVSEELSIDRYHINADGSVSDRHILVAAIAGGTRNYIAANSDGLWYLRHSTGSNDTVTAVRSPYASRGPHSGGPSRVESAQLHGLAASETHVYYARDGSNSVVAAPIQANRQNLGQAAGVMDSGGRAAQKAANKPYLQGGSQSTIAGMRVHGSDVQIAAYTPDDDMYTIYDLKIQTNGQWIPVVEGNNQDAVKSVLSSSVQLYGFDFEDPSRIRVHNGARSLAYCYLLRRRQGNSEQEHVLQLRDGDSATARRIFECNAQAATGGGYPTLNSPLTHESSIHFDILDGSGAPEHTSTTEWLIGLYTDPGPN